MLKTGIKAPHFSLHDQNLENHTLKNYLGKNIVLYFYPKDMTPGCTTEACDFQELLGRIKKLGAVVLGVSRDPAVRHLKFSEKYNLEFPLLSDEDGKICEAYCVWQEKSLYGKKFMGIVRTTFIIDSKGKIAEIFSKVKVKGHVSEVMAALKNLNY